jgi:hypothetical protein
LVRRVLYWVFTGLLAAWLILGGVFDLKRAPGVLEIMHTLGYPAYVCSILGVAKLLAVAALLYPRAHLLREWAYAGVTFDALGAFFSHVAVHDAPGATAAPLLFLAFAVVSYVCRPSAYRLIATGTARHVDRERHVQS